MSKVVKYIKKVIAKHLFKMVRAARKRSLSEAITKAKKINAKTSKKVLIYFIGGEYHAITKQEIRRKWHNGNFKGYSVEQMEKKSELILN